MKEQKGTSIFRNNALHIAVVLLLGVLAYANTLNSPFVFDDHQNITENPIIKDLRYFVSPSETEGFGQYFAFRKRFVGYLTFALNYALHGLDARGFHLANLAIHILSALALYLLVRLTFLTPRMEGSRLKGASTYIGLSVALLFVSHPLQTQAVTYIVQRLASLTALFYLGTVTAYAGARLAGTKGRKAGLYLLALVMTVLAMKTKENAFTLPMMLLLYEFVFFSHRWKDRLVWLSPFVLTLAIIPLTYLGAGGHGGDIISRADELTTIQNIPRTHYLLTEFRVLVTYLRLLLVPVDQNLYYDYPVYRSFLDPNVFLSFLLLAGLFATGIYMIIRPGNDEPSFRIAGFGIVWFFLAHAVESTLVPLYVIFEHRMYLPSAGLFLAVSVLGGYAYQRYAGARKPLIALMVAVPLVLAIATHVRNRVWQGEVEFWLDVTRKSPTNSAAFTNLANAYKERGEMQLSISNLRKALELSPNNDVAHNQLGLLLDASGDTESAVKEFRKALELNPGMIAARNNLGKVYLEQGKYGAAIEQYERSLSVRPDNPIALSNMGYAFSAQGEHDKAIEYFHEALRFDPGFADAYLHLGNTYAGKNMLNEAADAFQRVLMLDPENERARFNLANAFMRMNDFKKAAEEFGHLVKQAPDDASAHFALGAAWFNAEAFSKAIPPLKQAIRLDPDKDRPYLVLALAYLKEGQAEEARSTYEAMLKKYPDHPAAVRGLQQLQIEH